MGLLDIFKSQKSSSGRKGQKQKCPNCGETVDLSMERCPKCGVRIKSMFRRKCPKCKNLIELDAKKCNKCGYSFEAELQRAKKTYYVCPICGYKMEAMLTRCPACNRRFM
ncbi:MAG: zinc ribbon domain-containing protein [Candidatus Micrarchaeota archaeon]|nr:zinc ribbon domain-containing protein [Candidatus Micrarchaeota archaeon]MBU1682274.1 zinc ribbon domain-containing protein [Candidatus Micrarchaeota archaeon]